MITNQMKGTTDGQAYTVTVNDVPEYVLKLDNTLNISLVEQFYRAAINSTLLPRLLYTDPDKAFFVYTYITGTIHYNRGPKINWLTLLVNGLINHYELFTETDMWGFWLEEPCQTWREFIDQGVEYARNNVGTLLPIEDYYYVKSLVQNIPKGSVEERFLLHGDCGVHNFVFDQASLTGVIDPSPIVGPPYYDFIYAFCSSPDDLNLETLIPAFHRLNHAVIEESRLIEEVIIQLYCRIGICLIHHPHDLADYLKAWDDWKSLLQWDM